MEQITYQPLNLYSNYANAAKQFPQTKIVFDEILGAFPEFGFETTYQKSHELIMKRAAQLAHFGIKKGDNVIIYKSPKFDSYLLAVAVSYLAAVPVMVSYHLPTTTIEVFIERLEDPYVIYDEQTANKVAEVNNSSEGKQVAISDILNQMASPVGQEKLKPAEISYMTHTSGTTGIPKLICHSAESMGWRTKWQMTVFTKMVEKEIVAFHISPVHSRFNIGVSSLMAMGFPMLPLANATSESVSQQLKKYRPMALETHPNNFVQWSFQAVEDPDTFASVKYFHSTFDAINNRTMAAFLRATKRSRARFLQVYGQSECGPMILRAHTLSSLQNSNARDMGVGLGELTKARIADQSGNELPVNTNGNIHLLSKGRALTYYKEDERFQQTVFGKWWDSGDYGSIDERGHLFLKDRQVDLIEKIDSNLAIEDYLLDRLAFLQEVIIVRDQNKHAQPVISLAEGRSMDWATWWQAINDLPHLNPPLIREFEKLPRTATMKVQRLQLEQELKVSE
ncbi:MAG: AMP-binding protein [Enterococcus sp.]